MLLLTKIGFKQIKFIIHIMILQRQLPIKVHWQLMTNLLKQKILMYKQLYALQIKNFCIQELFIAFLTY
jgi:hypothetical protein